MYMFDNRISLESRAIVEEYLDGFEYETSGLSFSSLYMWRDINDFCWEIVGDYMCLSGISHLELEEGIILPFMFPPLTRTGEYDSKSLRDTIYQCRERFEKAGQPFSLRLVPAHMLEIIKDACPEIEFTDDRPNYDYVYMTQDLAELKGRAFHSKKNHINYFKKNYQYEYVELTPEMADEAMEFIYEFNRKKDIPANEMELLKLEERAIEDMFRNMHKVNCTAGAILIDGRIEALAMGGRLGSETIVEHVEKANTEYRGLYQVINNEFCRHIAAKSRYINREEDMGILNLRKAKLSYKPVKLVEKYIGVFKEKTL